MSNKQKIFRDPVHGYIAIDEDIVNKYIDTPQFQRLRRIKQTNLDVLFPGANQTRFEHSLGVYFLGKKLFSSILEKQPSGEIKNELEKYKYTFEMACLLHDIGHAPMSHIGETFYDIPELISELKKEGITVKSTSAPHEMMSVLIGLRVFGTELQNGGEFDKDLFFRSITGALRSSEGCGQLTDVKKAIIPLLNSAFDVDKMDYIMRDSASAGIPSIELDLERIFNSAALVEHPTEKLVIAFGKSGFSVVTAIINNRNYMFKWIYGHHKVQYHYHIVTKFIKKLCEAQGLGKIFSHAVIRGKKQAKFGGVNISHTDDYDLWSIFKNAKLPKDFTILREQLFNRNHYKPFWKTKIEFDEEKKPFTSKMKYIMEGIDNPDVFFEKEIKPKCSSLKAEDILMFKHDPKIVYPDLSSNMFFYLEDKKSTKLVVKAYEDIFRKEADIHKKEEGDKLGKFMFHIFVNKNKYTHELYEHIVKTLSTL